MQVDLAGRVFRLMGDAGAVSDTVAAALVANGATRSDARADLLVVHLPLVPDGADADPAASVQAAAREAESLAAARGGRVIFVLSAMGSLPMRRHAEYSAAMATAVATMRGLAMRLGPGVLVNAVGVGVVEDAAGTLLAGDRNMLTHASLGRAGTKDDVVNAVLFLCDPLNSYTTGQVLTVDGGWAAGYGRNF